MTLDDHPALAVGRRQLEKLRVEAATAISAHAREQLRAKIANRFLAPLDAGMAGGMVAPKEICDVLHTEASALVASLRPAPLDRVGGDRRETPSDDALRAVLARFEDASASGVWELKPPASDDEIRFWQQSRDLKLPSDLVALAKFTSGCHPTSGGDMVQVNALPSSYAELMDEPPTGFQYGNCDPDDVDDHIYRMDRLQVVELRDGSSLSCVVVPNVGLKWIDDFRETPQGFLNLTTAQLLAAILDNWNADEGRLESFWLEG